MKTTFRRFAVAALSGAFIATSTSCYTYYPPAGYAHTPVGDSKGGYAEEQAAPPARGYYAPRYVVDPAAVAVAGIAAAGILGYAIGHNHSHGGCYSGGHPAYYGGGYYRGGYH